MDIQEIHEHILLIALRHREVHPSFTFRSRTKKSRDGRSEAGYWFRGNENYVFFSPYNQSDWKAKASTIGYEVLIKGDTIRSVHIAVIFGSEDNRKLKDFYQKVVRALGETVIEGQYRYTIKYQTKDVEETFLNFLETKLPLIDACIREYKLDDSFFVPEDEYLEQQKKIQAVKRVGIIPLPVRNIEAEPDGIQEEQNSYWIFQGNPDIFDIDTYLTNKKNITWTVSRYKDQIEEGDKVLFWKSGVKAGVYAVGTVTHGASRSVREDSPEFWKTKSNDNNEHDFRCRLSIDQQFIENPILRSEILKHDWAAGISIIKNAQGSNFELSEIEYKNIIALLRTSVSDDKNYILYGPPGTGKTWRTLTLALSKIEETSEEELQKEDRAVLRARYESYRLNGQIAFTTFHQSFGYEEFVEGLKPSGDSEGGITYNIEIGVFYRIAQIAEENWRAVKSPEKNDFSSVWNDSRADFEENETLQIATKNGHFTIYEITDTTIRFEKNNGSRKHSLSVSSLRRFFNEPAELDRMGGLKTYYKALLEYLRTRLVTSNASKEAIRNHVLIIDEINRGNISKIFGELITLLEEDKRLGCKNEITVTLPYSRETFGVPPNLYVIGTMNTADRSIALMDTALRRRFRFEEMTSDPGLVDELVRLNEDISLSSILTVMNSRIEFLYDREHAIGHAYFLGIATKNDLDAVMRNRIIPLLQEYFYEDWEKIQMVLGDHHRQFGLLGGDSVDIDSGINNHRFVQSRIVTARRVLGFEPSGVFEDRMTYRVSEAFSMECYRKIYRNETYTEILKNTEDGR